MTAGKVLAAPEQRIVTQARDLATASRTGRAELAYLVGKDPGDPALYAYALGQAQVLLDELVAIVEQLTGGAL